MIKHMDERLDELRKLYNDTRESEYLHRFLEVKRLREVAFDEQIRREQSAQRSTRRSED